MAAGFRPDTLGSLSAPPDLVAAIWGLLLRGGGGRGRGGREGEPVRPRGGKERKGELSHFFVQVYAPVQDIIPGQTPRILGHNPQCMAAVYDIKIIVAKMSTYLLML